MLKKKRKKVVKLRGSHTHGGGSKKKRRGAGNRGGRGLAGSGKRADQKKPYILKYIGKKYFGKRGFKSIHKSKERTINLEYINDNFERLINEGFIKEENNKFYLNLKEFGYDKILGKGTIEKPIIIKDAKASKKAIEKIKKVGGEIIKD